MLNIGCHLSSSLGYESMAKTAISIGANTFQYFTRNPRGGAAKAVNDKDIKSYLTLASENNFAKVIAHAPYTMNLCSATEKIRKFSKNMLKDDILRTELISESYYNFHPGSHTGQGTDVGISLICEALNETLQKNQKTIVLLETMAGKGSEIGGKFEEIAKIRECVELKEKVGVCLDTCHIFDGGYDIVGNLDVVLEEFDKVIGIENLKAVHINDSKNSIGSHKDRHEKIGKGHIGIDAIENIINNRYLKNLPFILETPHDSIEGYAQEIKMLRNLYDE